jgi:hypothetical protein
MISLLAGYVNYLFSRSSDASTVLSPLVFGGGIAGGARATDLPDRLLGGRILR